jgi:hypothetical protein
MTSVTQGIEAEPRQFIMPEGQWLPTMARWMGDLGTASRQLSLDLRNRDLGALD